MKYKRLFRRKRIRRTKKVSPRSSLLRLLETKYDTNNLAIANYAVSPGTLSDLTAVAAGTSDVTRVGSRIRLVGLKGHYRMLTGTQDAFIRMMIFTWHPDNAASPTIGQLLDIGPSGVVDPDSLPNYNNRKQFTVLKDWKFYMNRNVTGFASSSSLKSINFTIPAKKLPRQTSFTTELNTGENHIFLLAMADSVNPQYLFTARIYFKDA